MDAESNCVAILMATHNGGDYLSEQLESIARQTYEDWHLVVSDDGSTDATLDMVASFSDEHPGKVTVLPMHEPTGSAKLNFFYLMQHCPRDFEYFAFADQDDWWREDKISKSMCKMHQLEKTSDSHEPLLVFCDAAVVDATRKGIAVSFFDYTGVDPSRTSLAQLLVQNPVSGAEVLANRALIELAANPVALECIDMHDQWLGLVAAAFGSLDYVDEQLYDYRQHGDNEVGAIEHGVSNKIGIASTSLRKKERQAGVLASTFGLDLGVDGKRLAEGFASIRDIGKMGRIAFCIRSGVWMNGLVNNIGLVLFI
jgi:glycosyltransferase involved in cell wall biosynthesis